MAVRAWGIAAVYLVVTALAAIVPRHSGNVFSRYMTAESIVERGTLAVEDSPLLDRSGSPDLVKFRGHLYSDKPPVLSAMAAVVYAPLAWCGVRFAGPPTDFVLANWVLVVALVAIPSALGLVAFRRLLARVEIPGWQADVVTALAGFGSLWFTYGVTFNNHSVAAGLLTGAFAAACASLGAGREPGQAGEPERGRAGAAAWVGLLAGTAAVIDLPAGAATLAALALWFAAVRGPVGAGRMLLGAAPALAVHVVLQSFVTGSPLPAEVYPGAFDYAGSYWVMHPPPRVPRGAFLIEMLLGPQGWLTVTPLVLYGLVGLALAAARRRDPFHAAALVVGGITLTLLVYYAWGVRRTDIAGSSFGTRHLLTVTPLVFFFAAVALARLRGFYSWLLFGLLAIVSVVYAFEGMRDPWSRVEERRARGDAPALEFLQRFVVYPRSSYER